MVKIPQGNQPGSSTDPGIEDELWEEVEIIEPSDIMKKIAKITEKLDIAEATTRY